MAIHLRGNSNTLAEVEAATKALKVAVRPLDIGSLGVYNLAVASGSMSAGLAANSPIFSMRWTSASNLCLIHRIVLQAATLGTGFTASIAIFNLFFARSFTVSDTGGTSVTTTSNNQKLRTSMGTSLFAAGDIRIASTGTLTAGTRTLDSTALASIAGTASATVQTSILSPGGPWGSVIFDIRVAEHPLVLAQNEGIVIQASVPATGIWQFNPTVCWSEVSSY